MNNEENDLFLKQMKGVTPLKKNNRLIIKKTNNKNKSVKKKIILKNTNNLKIEKEREVKHFILPLKTLT